MEEEQVKNLILQMIDDDNTNNQFAVSQTPFHTHNGLDSAALSYLGLKNKTRYILYRVVLNTSDVAVVSTVGGDLVMPFNGTFSNLGYTVDTAGTTGTMAIDFLLNAVTVISGVTIDSGSKTSRRDFEQSFSKNNFNTGDIVTFNVTAIQTTPAKGLTIFMKVIEQ